MSSSNPDGGRAPRAPRRRSLAEFSFAVTLCLLLLTACSLRVAPAQRPVRIGEQAGTAADGPAAPTSGAGDPAWTLPPIEEATVYAFSQVALNERDPQLLELQPDVVIRAWGWWDIFGHRASDYDFGYVEAAHAAGITFTGGGTASVLFQDEFPKQTQFDAIVTRNASGAIPARAAPPILYRASLANRAYRDYLVQAAQLQIDGGVDALFFDELNGSYAGAAYDGNEGYDDDQIGDFNAFLLDRSDASTDFASRFGMTPDNTLRRDVAPQDLEQNFDYRRYLAANGWASAPSHPANPLAALWGSTVANLPDPDATSFVGTAPAHQYWKDIADRVRAYARDQYGRKVLLTSNGIFPYVDFQSVGLYDYNRHGTSGASVDYVPIENGHLAGQVSLAEPFRWLKARSERFVPGAPVVLFIDWPGATIERYDSLPVNERLDYWRLYAAEAYANGLFFAFHLKTTTGEPSATTAGTFTGIVALAAYYRAHAAIFHDVTPATADVSGAPASAMITVMDQTKPDRRVVHLVNHEYAQGCLAQQNVALAIASVRPPARVSLASPDLDADVELPFEFAAGRVAVTVPNLISSDSVILTY